jgi:hypothetical protein
MAGYSGTPLPQKLGIKAGARVGLSRPPDDFATTLGELPEGVVLEDADERADKRPFDVVVAFVVTARELPALFERLKPRLDPAGGLWIGWPKKKPKARAAIVTDVTEALVREAGLAAGLVDNKVCAIDDTWSGLRFVVRLADRPKQPSKKPARA